jgi:hypothetical protein
MRVKLLPSLAIASVLLFCAMGVAAATTISGVPTAARLTVAADQQSCACGFPDLSSVGMVDTTSIVPADNFEATVLESPICGDRGVIPDCSCNEVVNEIQGPAVNLGCPLINTFPVPVNLNTPAVAATFAPINIAPQVCLGLPQVNPNGVCNDILCPAVTNINSCPIC